MGQVKGVKYINYGDHHYVRIDLDMYGDNPLLEDFLDLLEIEARKAEPTYTLEEVMKAEYERRGLNK